MKKQRAKLIASIVFLGIWFILALSIGLGAMSMWSEDKTFENWIIWGVLCTIPVIIPILKFVFESAREGARRGANDYTVTVTSSSVTVQNHPIRDALISLVLSVILSIVAGPFVLAFYVIKNIIKLIKTILALVKVCKQIKAEEDALKAETIVNEEVAE